MQWSRAKLTLLLGLIFLVNFVETKSEPELTHVYNDRPALTLQLAQSMHHLENDLSFESQYSISRLSVYGYSFAYFIVFPLLGLAFCVFLATRQRTFGYQLFCVAVAINYGLSLPFFLFYPVPERWTYPDSGAMLLSDLWSPRLIEAFRPIDGLDNCFPSFHVSLTVVIVAVAFCLRLRFRTVVCALGSAVILSTFVLGIHWIGDMVAGAVLGCLSVALAMRLTGSSDHGGGPIRRLLAAA